MYQNSAAKSLLKSIQRLPSPPTVMIKLANLLQDADSDLNTLYDTLRQDSALTAALLQQCGKTAHDARLVKTFEDAVNWLGFAEISRIAISHYAWQATRDFSIQDREMVEMEWHHAMFSAIIAGILARKLGEHESSAFTIGLLHDIGKLVLLSKDPIKFKEVRPLQGSQLCTQETLTFGANHAAIGAQLFLDWGLTSEMVGAVANHHKNVPHTKLGAILVVANNLALGIRDRNRGVRFQDPACVQALKDLEMTEEEVNSLDPDIQKDIKKYGALI